MSDHAWLRVEGERMGEGNTRVCFLGSVRYPFPLDETSARKFQVLSSQHTAFVIGFATSLRPRVFTQHARFYLMPSLPLPLLRYVTTFALGTLLALWCVLRHDVQVLVAQSPYEGLPAAWVKLLCTRGLRRRIGLVIESHGDFEQSLFLQRRIRLPGVYRRLMEAVARFALGYADSLRAVSISTARQLEAWCPGKPIVRFPTWTDIDVFLRAGSTRDAVQQHAVLYAGVLVPRKGVHVLVDAFAQIAAEFPQARLLIVGRPDNRAYARELQERIGRLRLSDRVEFMREVNQFQLAGAMARSSVFALPTISEGLPRVVFEAMAAGVPVVASSVSGIPEIVEDGVTGYLVPPGDAQALAGRLRMVFCHSEHARMVASRARDAVRQIFSVDDYVRSYTELIARTREYAMPAPAPSSLSS